MSIYVDTNLNKQIWMWQWQLEKDSLSKIQKFKYHLHKFVFACLLMCRQCEIWEPGKSNPGSESSAPELTVVVTNCLLKY